MYQSKPDHMMHDLIQLVVYILITDNTNQYVDVKFISSTSVTCEFLGEQQNTAVTVKSCAIIYGHCQRSNLTAKNSSTANIVNINLLSSLDADCCYYINATNGNFTVFLEGSYRKWIILWTIRTYCMQSLSYPNACVWYTICYIGHPCVSTDVAIYILITISAILLPTVFILTILIILLCRNNIATKTRKSYIS